MVEFKTCGRLDGPPARARAAGDVEDSPEGYPQSEPYGWWRLHDEYGITDRRVWNGFNQLVQPPSHDHAPSSAGDTT